MSSNDLLVQRLISDYFRKKRELVNETITYFQGINIDLGNLIEETYEKYFPDDYDTHNIEKMLTDFEYELFQGLNYEDRQELEHLKYVKRASNLLGDFINSQTDYTDYSNFYHFLKDFLDEKTYNAFFAEKKLLPENVP